MINQNSFPDLCELLVEYQDNTEDENIQNCMVVLRVSTGEVQLGDHECTVEFNRLYISVDHEGMEVVSGSLFGEPKKPNEVNRTSELAHKRDTKRNSSGALDISRTAFAANSKTEFGYSEAMNQDIIVREEGTELRVKARPNLRWEVREPDGTPLNSTLLLNDRLVAFSKHSTANRRRSSLSLRAKQRDIQIKPHSGDAKTEKLFAYLTTNKKRLLDIFIAKSLHEAATSSQPYRGEILISQCEHDHEE
ncbi:hypothetical protein MHM39_02340 [Phaeobacter sp. CNT1-3]|nr:hypothetical protein [Phaeobacter sp. CNT1-3]